jgi:small subunit ribosomal protein S7
MSRRKAAIKRDILPDPKFGSVVVAKFINVVMRRGKKSIAEKIVYGAFDEVVGKHNKSAAKVEAGKEGGVETDEQGSVKISESSKNLALTLFEKVLDVIRPTVRVKSRRVGGSNYQVPMEVKQDQGIVLAMRWLAESSKARKEKSMVLRLASEIMEALEGKGNAIRKREDAHKTAKANQAFAHYGW